MHGEGNDTCHSSFLSSRNSIHVRTRGLRLSFFSAASSSLTVVACFRRSFLSSITTARPWRVYVHVHVHVHVHMCTCACACAYARAGVRACVRACVHARACACVCACVRACFLGVWFTCAFENRNRIAHLPRIELAILHIGTHQNHQKGIIRISSAMQVQK